MIFDLVIRDSDCYKKTLKDYKIKRFNFNGLIKGKLYNHEMEFRVP